jgi:hypothetical protein
VSHWWDPQTYTADPVVQILTKLSQANVLIKVMTRQENEPGQFFLPLLIAAKHHDLLKCRLTHEIKLPDVNQNCRQVLSGLFKPGGPLLGSSQVHQFWRTQIHTLNFPQLFQASTRKEVDSPCKLLLS